VAYLFLAGVGAGAVTVSASILLRGGGFGRDRYALARYGAWVGPLPILVGTSCLLLELGAPMRFLNLFKLINLSPMSVGSWMLGTFIVVSLLYAASFLWPRVRLERTRLALAGLCVPLGIVVSVYTGVLLGAIPGRPFWNSPVIPLLFLLSALSAGVACIVLAVALFGPGHETEDRGDPKRERRGTDRHSGVYMLVASDAVLLAGELVAIFLFLMFAQLTTGDVRHAQLTILPGGQLASLFWGVVVLAGIVVPFCIEFAQITPRLLAGRPYLSHRALEIALPVAILAGGFALRYVIVVAGQITGPAAL
jgi:formate-dependent nitrite reductase membrane component NrfD